MKSVIDNIACVIRGKRHVVESIVTALVAGGHVLLEDLPGMGKTMVARALACSLDVEFRRLQCTPDLLPSDVMGCSVFNPKDQSFKFHRGPVFTNVLLVDEINRATPRTQSALLEAMAEQQVTVDGTTSLLAEPFFLIATQNPIEMAGTFPLPEAQLDRFLMKLRLGYPDDATEIEILQQQLQGHPIASLKACMSHAELLAAKQAAMKVHVDPVMISYVQEIVGRTRQADNVAYGVSPRGAIALIHACRAYASICGQNFVRPDHVKRLAVEVLAHRIVLDARARVQGVSSGEAIVQHVMRETSVPVGFDGD